jgi:hypothetical protein
MQVHRGEDGAEQALDDGVAGGGVGLGLGQGVEGGHRVSRRSWRWW